MRVEVPELEGLVLDDRLLDEDRRALESVEAPRTRLCYAAAHVCLRESYRAAPPGADPLEHLDWPSVARVRRHLDARGFGIAEAMDTAQRFELGWEGARRLIEACGELELANGFVAGAGADGVSERATRDERLEGVVEQARFIRSCGGDVVLLPLLFLARERASADEYFAFYRDVIDSLEGPLCLHWLGPAFLPELEDYFPGDSFERILRHAPDKLRCVKLSLLDHERERAIRKELLSRDLFVMTGDDFHFADLIGGDGPEVRRVAFGSRSLPVGEFSHALLGAFDAVAEPAGLALRALDAGDRERYDRLMRPCEELARAVFEAPTSRYKAGLAFLAWLDGLQENFLLLNRLERERDRAHYGRLVRLAGRAGVFRDASLTAERLRQWSRS